MNYEDLLKYNNNPMFYQEANGGGILIHNDCIKVLNKIDDNCFDLTLTDIPYNGVNRNDNGLRKLDKGDADIITFDINDLLTQLYRTTKGTIIIFCGMNQVSEIFNYFDNYAKQGKGTVRQLVWHKTNPSPMNGDYIYLSAFENAVWFKKKGATFNAHCKHNVFEYPCGRSKIHPTTKNFDLLKDLILDNSNEGDIILDPCAGSCSTLSMAKSLNRRFVGIELNEEFFKIGSKVVEKGYDNVWKEMKNQ